MTPILWMIFACGSQKQAPVKAPEEPEQTAVGATATAVAETWSGDAAPKSHEIAVGISDISDGTTSVELVCNAGHRDRQAVVPDAARIGGTVWFRGVGTDSCVLWFKGGPPAQFGPVTGGSAWLCTLVATTAVCQPK